MKAEQIQKAILEDKELLAFKAIRKAIIEDSTTFLFNSEGFVQIMDERTKIHLDLIDRAILSRIEQITNYYNR